MLGLLLAVIFVTLGCLYFDSKKKHEFWKTKGVPFMKPSPFFGNSFKMMFMKQSQGELAKEAYFTNKDKKYVGIYEFTTPILIPIDSKLIENILVKDFSHFVDHGMDEMKSQTEVDEGLFHLQGSQWRALRYKMLPAFSTGKLRGMFDEMVKCSRSLVNKLENLQHTDIDMSVMAKEFVLSIIASCAFGLEISMEPDSEFMRMGTEFSKMTAKRYLQTLFLYFFPRLAKIWNITFTPKHAAKYFAGLIRETFSYRLKNNVMRKDFVQLLLELKEKGSIELNKSKDNEEDNYLRMDTTSLPTENIEVTDTMLISQAYTFIQAGFDGLTLTIMFTLFEISLNQEIQDRARKDIECAVQKHGGLTFDALKEATFLSSCVTESLRKYPLCPILYRKCTKRYILDDGTTIEPGTKVFIPVLGLLNDPDHYSDPHLFRPDRFLEEYSPFTNYPFGDGPRMCIAMRFSLLVIKLACAVTLLNFKLCVSSNTQLPLKMDIKSFLPKPLTPVLFKLSKTCNKDLER